MGDKVPNLAPGDAVTWGYGPEHRRELGWGAGYATGTVLESGLEKFGYDDVIAIESDRTGQTAYIRPEDLVSSDEEVRGR